MQVKSRLEAVPNLADKHILLSKDAVLQLFDWKSVSPLYRAIKVSDFPMPLKCGRRSMWRKSDVLAWIDSRPQELDLVPQITKKGAMA